jgi:hypothetical protein
LIPLAKDEKFTRSQSVVARIVGGETLIVPVRNKVGDLASIYSMNETGTLIWKLLESPQTLAELANSLAQHFEVDLGRADSDVTNFVREMHSVGIIESSASMAVSNR